jgi:tRNA 2-thiouridine synthesizing protein A
MGQSRGRGTHDREGPEAAADVVPDDTLDTVGLYCPVPIIKTAERVRTLAPGQVLEVLSDDRVILIDMPAWCKSTRNEYLGSRRVDGEYHLYLRKGRRLPS